MAAGGSRASPAGQAAVREVVELVALGSRGSTVRARDRRSGRCWWVLPERGVTEPVAGELFTLAVRPGAAAADRPWLVGRVLARRIDLPALGCPPLGLHPRRDRSGGPAYELERVGPRGHDRLGDPAHWLDRPPEQAPEGRIEARIAEAFAADLRYLDGHACLGFLAFRRPRRRGGVARARRHFRVALGIAEQTLGPTFAGRLPWRYRGNRPYLRCLAGLGLCLWRSGETSAAQAVFERLRRLDPGDGLIAPLSLRCLETAWS